MIAASTAFGEGTFGFQRKTLLGLLALAVLVNFSAFFTLLLFDISHLLFAVLFNIAGITPENGLGGFLVFSAYDSAFSSVLSDMENSFFMITQIVVNWFIALGFFYFSLILIQRFLIAIILVIASPLAALGLVFSRSGSGSFSGKIAGIWSKWSGQLGQVFFTPLVLIFGLSVLVQVFTAIVQSALSPEKLGDLGGFFAEPGLLAQLLVASILLIIGIFHVGKMAQNLDLGVGKFKLSTIAKAGEALQSFKPIIGAAKNAPYIRNTRWAKGEKTGIGKARDGIQQVWKGGRSDAVNKLLDERGRRSARSGDIEKSNLTRLLNIASQKDLSKQEVRRLLKKNEAPLLHASLVSSGSLKDKDIDQILLGEDGKVLYAEDSHKSSVAAAADTVDTSTETLRKISASTEIPYKVRQKAENTLRKQAGEESDIKFSDDTNKSVVKHYLESLKGARANIKDPDLEKFKKGEDFDTLKAFSTHDSVAVRVELAKHLSEFGNTDTEKELFKELVRDGNTRVVSEALKQINDHTDHETAITMLDEVLGNNEITNRNIRNSAERAKIDLVRKTIDTAKNDEAALGVIIDGGTLSAEGGGPSVDIVKAVLGADIFKRDQGAANRLVEKLLGVEGITRASISDILDSVQLSEGNIAKIAIRDDLSQDSVSKIFDQNALTEEHLENMIDGIDFSNENLIKTFQNKKLGATGFSKLFDTAKERKNVPISVVRAVINSSHADESVVGHFSDRDDLAENDTTRVIEKGDEETVQEVFEAQSKQDSISETVGKALIESNKATQEMFRDLALREDTSKENFKAAITKMSEGMLEEVVDTLNQRDSISETVAEALIESDKVSQDMLRDLAVREDTSEENFKKALAKMGDTTLEDVFNVLRDTNRLSTTTASAIIDSTQATETMLKEVVKRNLASDAGLIKIIDHQNATQDVRNDISGTRNLSVDVREALDNSR